MHSRKLYLVVFFAAFLCPIVSFGQEFQPQFSFGIKYMGLTVHLKKSAHPQLYKLKLDKKGYAVVNHGMVLIAEYFVAQNASIRFSQALVPFDCAGQFLGGSQIAFSYGRYISASPNEIRVSAGPMWFYRKNWQFLKGYVDDGLFKVSKNGKWQSKFVWHGGEIEYNYWLKSKQAFSLNWMPGIPELFTFAPGMKFMP